jgi:hypothetical protein
MSNGCRVNFLTLKNCPNAKHKKQMVISEMIYSSNGTLFPNQSNKIDRSALHPRIDSELSAEMCWRRTSQEGKML